MTRMAIASLLIDTVSVIFDISLIWARKSKWVGFSKNLDLDDALQQDGWDSRRARLR